MSMTATAGRLACLGDVAEFINGVAFKPEDWGDEGSRIIRIQNLTDPSKPYNRTTRQVPDRYHVRPGELLVSWSASLGVFEWAGPDAGLLNQHIFRVVPGPEVDNRYLRYCLEIALEAMGKHLHGATMQHINRGEFLGTRIPLPPLPEQRRIAAILDQADALRTKRRHALARLDTLTQSIFLEMFGDPATNPRGWPMKKLGDLILSASYGTSQKAGESGRIQILRMNNLTVGGEMDLTSLKYIDLPEGRQERYLVRNGDVLFNRTNSPDLVGKTAVYRGPAPMAYAGYLIRLRTNEDATSEFISAFLNSKYGKLMLRGMCKSIIGMANINATEIQSVRIMHPPVSLQREFAERLVAIAAAKLAYRASLARLDSLFTSLQDRAFRGEL